MSTITMPKVFFIDRSGQRHEVDTSEGTTIMRAAIDNSIPGIEGDCGGNGACGTCHVFVDERWLALTGERSEMEVAMLTCSPVHAYNSRLSCQITLRPELDGVEVVVADSEY